MNISTGSFLGDIAALMTILGVMFGGAFWGIAKGGFVVMMLLLGALFWGVLMVVFRGKIKALVKDIAAETIAETVYDDFKVVPD